MGSSVVFAPYRVSKKKTTRKFDHQNADVRAFSLNKTVIWLDNYANWPMADEVFR
jgi:hypothetical protein